MSFSLPSPRSIKRGPVTGFKTTAAILPRRGRNPECPTIPDPFGPKPAIRQPAPLGKRRQDTGSRIKARFDQRRVQDAPCRVTQLDGLGRPVTDARNDEHVRRSLVGSLNAGKENQRLSSIECMRAFIEVLRRILLATTGVPATLRTLDQALFFLIGQLRSDLPRRYDRELRCGCNPGRGRGALADQRGHAADSPSHACRCSADDKSVIRTSPFDKQRHGESKFHKRCPVQTS
ncbi:hypothetical protein BPS26883_00769 [Burkholderia pseudomultivorans]|uniref:Uncharacterized protein n=1 Tax=Burkholderia pseudomultivorans TaxID=1207504 RepID=A0A6P2HNU2_9BURK|nr:hypothetical protein BPS26883_00769 [Burkholderia pseudomultivorans]